VGCLRDGRLAALNLIVLDSVPGLYAARGEDDVADGGVEALARARLLSEAMRRLAANIDRTRTIVLFCNRLAADQALDMPSVIGVVEQRTGRVDRLDSPHP
jgi:RecA/RadA recombinase